MLTSMPAAAFRLSKIRRFEQTDYGRIRVSSSFGTATGQTLTIMFKACLHYLTQRWQPGFVLLLFLLLSTTVSTNVGPHKFEADRQRLCV